MRWPTWVAAAAVLAVAVVVVALSRGGLTSGASSLSRSADGWLAARRYLAERGTRVRLLTEPPQRFLEGDDAGGAQDGDRTAGRGSVLVLAFPWQELPQMDLEGALDGYLARGGDVVVAYGNSAGPAEELAGLRTAEKARQPPLTYWRWRRFVREQWDLRPTAPGWLPVRIWAPRRLPRADRNAQVLYTGPAGEPVVTVSRRGRGHLVVLPADALSNARLAGPGNVNLLETLRQNLGRRWVFDEYDHGLITIDKAADPRLGLAFDLLLAHLVLLYVLALLALARRQGPPWSERPPLAGSAATFLLGLGGLHHRLGHHREAARLLLARVRELDRGLVLPAALDQRAATAGPADLVALAREVARRRRGRTAA